MLDRVTDTQLMQALVTCTEDYHPPYESSVSYDSWSHGHETDAIADTTAYFASDLQEESALCYHISDNDLQGTSEEQVYQILNETHTRYLWLHDNSGQEPIATA